jgi:uracil-DNA glycosylase family 4
MVIQLDDQCILCNDGHAIQSFSLGPKDATIAVVTNRKNSPKFQLELEQQLTEAGLDVSTIYFTPVIKCRDFDVTLTNKQLKEHAAELLLPELERVRPTYVLALGNEALLATTGKSGITKYRGKAFDGPAGSVAIATISPSAVHRNPGQKPAYLADIRLFVNRVKGRATGVPDPKYVVGDTKESLAKIWRILDMTEELNVDIETSMGEYYQDDSKMVSIAATCVINTPEGKRGVVAFAIPLAHPQSVWRNQWEKVLHLFARHIGGIKRVVAHNSSFDCKWLIWYGVKLYPTFDTMLAIHLLNENVQKGLKPQAMARLGVEPWGIDTGQLDKYPLADVLHYNVLDTWYMYHLKLQLVEELKEQPRLARIFAKLTMPAQRELIDSEIRGIWIDVQRLNERKPQAEANLARIENEIRAAAELPSPEDPDWPRDARGRPMAVNFNASIFARWMLFQWCGLPALERGKPKPDGSPGDPSMAEGVLMALKDEHPVVKGMLERVTAQKHISSFFNPYSELYDEEHRIHTTFKLAGTVTGRLSSGKADADKISGSRGKMRGVNLQQVPRDPFIRGLFGAPPGWTFVESDYSQVELRVAAFLADETTMKHIYATGGDIHLSTASRVTGLPESQVTKEIRKKVGKPVNFGFLYGMGANKFISTAFENYGSHFTLEEAQGARRAYFELYPKLLPWHARQRRLVNEYGRVQSPLGRIRHLPDVYSPDQGVRAEAERQAINSPVQGFASDLAVLSMNVINQRFREQGIMGYCLGLVHDAINYEIRDDHLARALPIIKDTMEDMDIVYRKFGTVVDIPIIADVAIGRHWGDKLELTPDQVYDFKLEYRGQ